MITAYFENGRPHVSAHIEIPRLNITGTIPLLVDTGADNTCIHPKDGPELLIPYQSLNRPATVRGIAGTSQRYLEDAVISFRDSLGTPVFRYRVTVRIGKPDDVDLRLPSLLGQDLLRNWRNHPRACPATVGVHPKDRRHRRRLAARLKNAQLAQI